MTSAGRTLCRARDEGRGHSHPVCRATDGRSIPEGAFGRTRRSVLTAQVTCSRSCRNVGELGLNSDTWLQTHCLNTEDTPALLTSLSLGVFFLRTDFWVAERTPFLGSEHPDRSPAIALFCGVIQETDFPVLGLNFITK